MAIPKQKLFDSMCWDLAKHFLSDLKGATDMDATELAEALQHTAEDFCSGLAADEAGEEVI